MTTLDPIIITGPTAGGKSDLAEKVCDALDGIIINADSLQMYKGLPCLTAQPETQEERHTLYSVFEPGNKCDVIKWIELVELEISRANAQGKRPIIVGGTGFYLKVLLGGIAPIPPIPETIFQHADWLVQTYGLGHLIEDLIKKDPDLPKHLQHKDPQRVLRAWTVLKATGISLRDWYKKQTQNEQKFIKILRTRERDVLYKRINQRFDLMWTNGIIEEVQVFNSKYSNITNNYAVKAIGFAEVDAYLKGDISAAKAIELAQTKTRQYAKRQLTWFRHQFKSDVVIETNQNGVDEILNFVDKWETKTYKKD
ncbi:MAG: tRNA (adenosine(37)-N6)-dimethylallyltransferase MiaA [Candidatus Paracaedibacteraceae bacterium]|nr:tRNA (adenosine(37)-N6)-dimethylallyltransferase MiaA [Candidatus Paracaedibacteraceae bacterium]